MLPPTETTARFIFEFSSTPRTSSQAMPLPTEPRSSTVPDGIFMPFSFISMAEPVPLSAEFISSLPGTLSLPVPKPQRSLSLPSRGSNAPPLDFLSSSHFESISPIFFSGSFIFPFAEDEKRVILTLCPAASFISLTADVSIWRERSLFSSSDMQSKTALPTFFASFPSMSALTAVFIIADEDENSRLCFMPSYATRPTKTAAAAHKSAIISFFELFFIGLPPQSRLPYTYNIHILHCFSSNFKDLKLSFSTAKKYRNISLSIQNLLFKLDVQKNTKILLKLNKISSFLW